MRIKSLLAVVVAGLALSLSACGTQAELVEEPNVTPVETPAPEQSVTAMAACKLAWTCDYQRYYTTQAQCTAACGGTPCSRDYACTGGCICP